jgi:hypothetical protein
VVGFTVLGTILGNIDYWLFTTSGFDLALRVLIGIVSVLAIAALIPVEERAFVRYVSWDSERPGLSMRVEHGQYHRYIHLLEVRAENQLFGVTVFGLPGRVREAVALASEIA